MLATAPNTPEPQVRPLQLSKRIGSTTYKMRVHFSKTSKENINDKLMRLIEQEAMTQCQKN